MIRTYRPVIEHSDMFASRRAMRKCACCGGSKNQNAGAAQARDVDQARRMRDAAESIFRWKSQRSALASAGFALRDGDSVTRSTEPLGFLPLLKEWTHLPVLVDPTRAPGCIEALAPMACGDCSGRGRIYDS